MNCLHQPVEVNNELFFISSFSLQLRKPCQNEEKNIFLNFETVLLAAVKSKKLRKAHCSPPLVGEDNSMVLTSHSVPFPATRCWKWHLVRDKNHFIFFTPVTANKYRRFTVSWVSVKVAWVTFWISFNNFLGPSHWSYQKNFCPTK